MKLLLLLLLLPACQEYLVTFKLMASPVGQRAQSLKASMGAARGQRVQEACGIISHTLLVKSLLQTIVSHSGVGMVYCLESLFCISGDLNTKNLLVGIGTSCIFCAF